MRSPELFALIAIANVPVYVVVFRWAFDGWAELRRALEFCFLPRALFWLAVLRAGDYTERRSAGVKLLALLVGLGLTVASEYVFLADHFPALVPWASGLSGRVPVGP